MEQFGSTAVKAEILDTAEKVADTPSKDMSKILVFKIVFASCSKRTSGYRP